MIKKSLVVASLLLAGTCAVAGDYINIGVGTSTTSYTDGSDNIDGKWSSLFYNKIHKDYLLTIDYSKASADTAKLVFSDEPNETYKYDYDGSRIGIYFAYKILKRDKVFFAPYLMYSKFLFDTKFTRNSDNALFTGTETSDDDLNIGFMLGYDYAEDSFTYVEYSLDNDILESEDNDYNTLSLGIHHKLYDKFSINFAYFQDMSNPDDQKSSEGIAIGVGYKFN